MTNEESARPGPRRTPRQGVGSSPVGSTLSVVFAIVAVVAGFLILRNITDDDDVTGDVGGVGADVGDVDSDGSTEADGTGTPGEGSVDGVVETSSTIATTTTVARVTDGATVVVANANTVGGSAGAMTKTLELAGYTMGAAVNASGPNLTDSIVYYDGTVAGAQAVAESVARDLGDVEVDVVPTPAPTESGSLGEASVLVLLGDNQAGRSLEELAPEGEEGSETVAAPDPSGSDAGAGADAPADTADADATSDDATDDAETDDTGG